MSGPLFFNRIKENTATVGTGAISLAGVPAGGFFPFSNVGNTNTCTYTIDDGNGNVEVGQGTYTAAGNTLSRDSVETSTNGNALVNFGAGNKTIWLDVPASIFTQVPRLNISNTFTAAQTTALGAITTSQPDIWTQTWNAVGTTFTGKKTNITNTASAAGSLIEDWQVGGVSQASISTAGNITATGGTFSGAFTASNNVFLGGAGGTAALIVNASTANVNLYGGSVFGWAASFANGVLTSGFSQLGAASLALGNGTANDFTGSLKLGTLTADKENITTTSTDGIVLSNATVATVSVQVQQPPRKRDVGAAWNTSGTPATNVVEFIQEMRPAAGSTPTGAYVIASRVSVSGSGSFTDRVSIYDNGDWTINDAGTKFYFSGGRFLAGISDATGTNTSWVKATAFLSYGSGGIGFSSAGSAGNDSNITRLGAASLALGNGTQGDFSGSLKLTTLTAAGGNVVISTVGKGLQVKEGSNAKMGTGSLVGGTATISTTAVTASSRIFLSDTGGGVLTNIGALSVGTVTVGTSFVVNSSNVLDSSNFAWIIIEPA